MPRPLVLGKPPPKPQGLLQTVLLSDIQFVEAQLVPPAMSLSFFDPLPERTLLLNINLPKFNPDMVKKDAPELGRFALDMYRMVLMEGAS
jgi:hypothetical protein